jgi:hypothetical protein
MSNASYQRQWAANHRESERARHRRVKRERRSLVLELLGNKCVRCGFDDKRALQIDHVHDDGYIERAALGPSWYRKIQQAIIDGERGRYQLLCANCNWIKRVEQS